MTNYYLRSYFYLWIHYHPIFHSNALHHHRSKMQCVHRCHDLSTTQKSNFVYSLLQFHSGWQCSRMKKCCLCLNKRGIGPRTSTMLIGWYQYHFDTTAHLVPLLFWCFHTSLSIRFFIARDVWFIHRWLYFNYVISNLNLTRKLSFLTSRGI